MWDPSIFHGVRLRYRRARCPVNSVTCRRRAFNSHRARFTCSATERGESDERAINLESDEQTGRLVSGRSYRDYISHFRSHSRDLKPLRDQSESSFSLSFSRLSSQQAWGQRSRLSPNGRRAQCSIQISHVRHFSPLATRFTRVPPSLPPIFPRPSPVRLFQRSQRQYRTDSAVTTISHRLQHRRTFPAARVLSRASTLNLINRRGS